MINDILANINRGGRNYSNLIVAFVPRKNDL
jgi:hypothetical protein